MHPLLIFAAMHGAFQPRLSGWDLYCGGDIMLNGVSPTGNAFAGILVPREAIFYANLEIPLTNTPERTPRKSVAEIAARNQFVLKADPRHINDLVEAGIDVVSLGNNHAMDGGVSGVKQMLSLLDKHGIQHSGAGVNWQRAVEPAIVISQDGTRVAFISYLSFLNPESLRKCTPAKGNAPGIAAMTLGGKNGPTELARLTKIVDQARENADMVIVALHWGIEKQPFPAAYQVSSGRVFIDAGADVVLGAHPHVLQPGEVYKGKPIIYSLGNFVNPGGGQSALYKLTFEKGAFRSAEIIPTTYSGGLTTASSRDPKEISRQEKGLLSRYPSPESAPLSFHP